MIPQGGQLPTAKVTKVVQQPSRTYRLDVATGRIMGMIDGLESIQQTVYQILQTERFEHLIYSTNYGFENSNRTDNDSLFFESRITRLIREALMQDDRIRDVQDWQVLIKGDEAVVTFTVVSKQGNFRVSKEVNALV
ncbi:DUF2634 domain-containing protein [Paenibacillus periandrae]|uniref:DUF2634 domain-containing protein n=1 Tax=Paenibacillus periandrae TaxID=1761741 RepID=UPI001F08C4C9|nr:DUF2634 domain-containing protein [Paenibacillus periandrae]